MLHVAWLGDSQVMLVRRGQAVELMKPHKPDREVRMARFKYTGAAYLKLTGITFMWDAGTLRVALPMSLGAAAYVPVILLSLEVGMDSCANPLFSSGGACSLHRAVFVKHHRFIEVFGA